MKTRHLVIGSKGEVGSALVKILSEEYETFGIDMDTRDCPGGFDVVHVAIPYGGKFVDAVNVYRNFAKPNAIVVNHSTVPVGTTRKLGEDAVHSPIRGVHPNLVDGIKTFAKYFGGPRGREAAAFFSALGIETRAVPRPETTEAAKLWCTTAYGLQILIEKAIHDYCYSHDLDFDVVYTYWTESYNEGFEKLGMPYVRRPVLKHVPGKIGGHCIVPNAKMLDSWLADLLVKSDEELFPQSKAT